MSQDYYRLARIMRGQKSAQDTARLLSQFHQSMVDEAVQVACLAIEKTVSDKESADKAKNELLETYVEAGFVSDDRRALARTEAILAAVISTQSASAKKYILSSKTVDEFQAAGHGVDVTGKTSGELEVVLHEGKYALR